jgi:hypothetical protein
MTNKEREELWELINEYVKECGGIPAEKIYNNTIIQNLVYKIDGLIFLFEQDAKQEGKLDQNIDWDS